MSAGFSTSPGGGRFDRLTDSNLLNGRWLGLVFALIGGVIIWSVATVPLSDGGQAILGLPPWRCSCSPTARAAG